MIKGIKHLRFVFSLLFLVASLSLYANKKDGITIYGTYKVNGSDKSGVQIRLLRNGIKESTNSSGNGKFEYDLKFNNQYELQFSKSGYITKKVVVSTDVPERVLESNSSFPPFKIEITLFREVEGGDYSIFDEPVALVIYDKELDDFDFDRAYNAEIEEEIKAVETKIINAPVAQKVDENLRLYNELIKKADSEFDAKSYVNAKKNYGKALELKPRESYPQIRIGMIDKLLADLAKREKQKKQTDAYYALIDKADVLLDEKKYPQARSYYVQAAELKPEQQYPKDKIKLIDQIFAQREAEQRKYDNTIALADRYFKEEQYEPAKKSYQEALKMRKDESYPKAQIKRIERLLSDLQTAKEKQDNYNKAIAQADNFFQNKNWFDAQDNYQKASDLLPEKRYPKDKIKEIDKILKAEQKDLDDYTAAIKRADSYFEKENWENAQTLYEKALKVKPEESYPKAQIEKITATLSAIAAQNAKEKAYTTAISKGDRAFDKRNWEEAKAAYFDALKLKTEENYPQERIKTIEEKLADLAAKQAKENRYDEKLKQADLHYDQKQWNDAIAQYKAALEIKPSESYPKLQIKKIERFLKEELAKQTALEKEEKYNSLIAEGDQAYNAKNWDKALGSYEGALQIKPQAGYPKSRISAVNRKIKASEQEEKQQKAYDMAVAQADSLYGKHEWLPAIARYDKALDIKPKEDYPKTQISEIKARLSAEELAKQEALKATQKARQKAAYNEAVDTADKALADKHYGVAKQNYRKALRILPEEKYPKDKLLEIENLLQQKQEAENQYYKKITPKQTAANRYYKKINPSENTKQRYVDRIDATQPNESKYEALMQKATELEMTGNIPFAKAYYRQAYLVKPSLQLFNKLKELNRRTKLTETKE